MTNPRIYVAGHRGLVGSAMVRALAARPARAALAPLAPRGQTEIVTRDRSVLDLEDQPGVQAFFAAERPDVVILAAARVGGIGANSAYPADFIRSNLAIQCNVIEAAYRHGVQRLLFLGSACIYPRLATQPIGEDQFLTGPLEPTNQAYAVAKIAGIEMCRAYNAQYGTRYLSVQPTNLYGPGDNFDLANSHVLPAMIRRLDEARARGDASVTFWGTGTARREFLHVDDMAEASLMLLDAHQGNDIVNIGSGEDVSIAELAELVRGVVGYAGRIEWDHSKPDGMPRRQLDVRRLFAYGWRPRISVADGVASTYAWYSANRGNLRSE